MASIFSLLRTFSGEVSQNKGLWGILVFSAVLQFLLNPYYIYGNFALCDYISYLGIVMDYSPSAITDSETTMYMASRATALFPQSIFYKVFSPETARYMWFFIQHISLSILAFLMFQKYLTTKAGLLFLLLWFSTSIPLTSLTDDYPDVIVGIYGLVSALFLMFAKSISSSRKKYVYVFLSGCFWSFLLIGNLRAAIYLVCLPAFAFLNLKLRYKELIKVLVVWLTSIVFAWVLIQWLLYLGGFGFSLLDIKLDALIIDSGYQSLIRPLEEKFYFDPIIDLFIYYFFSILYLIGTKRFHALQSFSLGLPLVLVSLYASKGGSYLVNTSIIWLLIPFFFILSVVYEPVKIKRRYFLVVTTIYIFSEVLLFNNYFIREKLNFYSPYMYTLLGSLGFFIALTLRHYKKYFLSITVLACVLCQLRSDANFLIYSDESEFGKEAKLHEKTLDLYSRLNESELSDKEIFVLKFGHAEPWNTDLNIRLVRLAKTCRHPYDLDSANQLPKSLLESKQFILVDSRIEEDIDELRGFTLSPYQSFGEAEDGRHLFDVYKIIYHQDRE